MQTQSSSSLQLREMLLGVLKARDIDNRGVIHTSDFKAALNDLGLLMGSQEVEDILIHCRIGMDGSIDFKKLESELKLERQVYNSRHKPKKNVPKTSTGSSEAPWRADIAHKEKLLAEKQTKLIFAHKDEVHDIYNKFTHGEISVDDTISALETIDIVATKAFRTLVRQSGGSLLLPDISFAEFKRALNTSDVSSTNSNTNNPDYSAGSTAGKIFGKEQPMFASRKRIDQNLREALQRTTNEVEIAKPVKKLVMEVNEKGEQRTKFRSSTAIKDSIFYDKGPSFLLSTNQLNMQTGYMGEEVDIKYTSEQKFLREQILAAMRKLDGSTISLSDFVDKVYEIGFSIPDELLNELKKTSGSGKIDWNRCVKLLDANVFKIKALEERVSAEDVAHSKQMLIDALRSKGHESLSELLRCFDSMDTNKDRVLSLNEFRQGVRKFGLSTSVSDEDIRNLYNYMDISGDALLSLEEFLQGIRGDLNATRKRYIRWAYTKLDETCDEQVPVDRVVELFNAEHHPDVKGGTKTKREAVTSLILAFDNNKSVSTPMVSYRAFESYNSNLSVFIDDDNEYVSMMKGLWQISDKAPPPPVIKSTSIVSRPKAKQSHGDVIKWDQEISLLEKKEGEKVVNHKSISHLKDFKPSKLSIAWIPTHGKARQPTQEEIDAVVREEWKSHSNSRKPAATDYRYSSSGNLLSWDTSAKASKKQLAETEVLAKQLADLAILNSRSTDKDFTTSKKINTDAILKFEKYGEVPYGTDLEAPKVKKTPKPLSSVFSFEDKNNNDNGKFKTLSNYVSSKR